MTTNEIKIEAMRVIEKVITLKANVSNGCMADCEALATETRRLAGIKSWAIENDKIQDIRHFLGSKNWGYTFQFAANDVRTFFNS